MQATLLACYVLHVGVFIFVINNYCYHFNYCCYLFITFIVAIASVHNRWVRQQRRTCPTGATTPVCLLYQTP